MPAFAMPVHSPCLNPAMARFDRYSRQILYSGLGEAGQERLARSRVLLVGCGALGSVLADLLVRAGVGFLRICDRDFVELTNLQRQVLFDEADVADQLPKAVAAVRKLQRINSDVEAEAVVADVGPDNILVHADGMDLILDGTDNFETRFLINDASLETGIPWIYAGCIGSHGQILPILPGETPCLRCLIETMPLPGTVETCDTAGILGPTVNVVASLEAMLAVKLLAGRRDDVERVLTVVDVWDLSLRKLNMQGLLDRGTCPACHAGDRSWLRGDKGSQTTVLCGRNAVQITPRERLAADLNRLETLLASSGEVRRTPYLLRFVPRRSELEFSAGAPSEEAAAPPVPVEMTLFPDGRAIIKGTNDASVARAWYARYFGA